MNALDRKFMNVGNSSRGACFLGAAVAAALLSGCAAGGIASVKVDPDSPIAPEVAQVAVANKAYPKFTDIPPAPTELRAPAVYGQRATELKTARAELDSATAPNTWTLGGTQAFLGRARRDAGPGYTPPGGSDTESFADTVRKRATPPPPATP
jgi:hypothetical protein